MADFTYLAWHIESKQPLERQVAAAIVRFEQRFGRPPTELLVPPGSALTWPGLEVRRQRNIPAHHVWVGADLAVPALPEAATHDDPGEIANPATARRIA